MSSSVTSRLALLLSSKRTADNLDYVTNDDRESDEALLARISGGDRDALAQLFVRYSRSVRQIGYRILRDDSEADDVLQDIFVFIYGKCGLFDASKGTGRSWIVQVTYSRAIDRRRQLAARHFYKDISLDNEVLDVLDCNGNTLRFENSLEGVFGKEGIKQIFDSLSGNQRKTLMLFFFEGYNFAEIADSLGQSIGNIRNHYFRGLDKLRQIAADKGKKR